jgi:hypothetical protein
MFTSTNNYLLDLKIKEYEQFGIKYKIYDNILFNCDKTIVMIGCDKCYGKKPYATPSGYSIDAGPLITYYEKYTKYITAPIDFAKNCWMCPKCSRVFQELIPNYEYLEVKNVSIQNN